MQARYRLRKNSQFRYTYRKGKSAGDQSLILHFVRGPKLLVGIAVSKKVGNAVVRNRVKRRLREAFRQEIPNLKCGMYVITVKENAGKTLYEDLRRSLRNLLNKQKLFKQRDTL